MKTNQKGSKERKNGKPPADNAMMEKPGAGIEYDIRTQKG